MDKKEILAHTIDCENRQMSFFDKETIEPLCKVQILENTATGDISWGWKKRNPEDFCVIVIKHFELNNCDNCIWKKLEKDNEFFIYCATCTNYLNFKPDEELNQKLIKIREELMKDDSL